MTPTRTLVLALLAALAGCKEEESCNPGQVQWGVQLLVEGSSMLNLDANGDSLPTVVRLYQVRGELVLDGLDFQTIWEAEDPEKLGDGFLGVEEMTIYPGQRDERLLPIESSATHIVAAAWFREPLGNTWFSAYEIPLRHPEVVCDKAPEDRVYPNPCYYVLLDRSLVSGGATPPAGFQIDERVKCAPLGVVPGPKKDKKKKKKKRKRDPSDLEDPLKTTSPNDAKVPTDAPKPEAPRTDLPGRPRAPDVDVPSKPSAPSVPGDPR